MTFAEILLFKQKTNTDPLFIVVEILIANVDKGQLQSESEEDPNQAMCVYERSGGYN